MTAPSDIVAAAQTPDGDTDLTAAQVTRLLSSGTRETLTTSREAAETYIRPLVAAGLQIIPLVPGAKNPALTEWQRIPVTNESWTFWLDDAYARRNAFSTGRPALGLGLRAGARMVPADADTDAQFAVLNAFAANMGLDAPVPTTSTPGTVDRRHANGGHWWFLLPADFAIPNTLPGVLKVDARGNTGADAYGDTFDLFLYGHQAAIPPTVREPGEYTLTGPVYDMPEKMREWLIHQGTLAEASHAAAVAERAARVNRGESNPAVNIWEDDHSWADILTTANWIETGRDARCGCTQWRHPEASSEKSATAHECARGTYLHLWSTSSSVLEAGSYRKMYVDAALHHGGDYAAACRSAGIPPVSRAIPSLDLALACRRFNGDAGTEDDGADGETGTSAGVTVEAAESTDPGYDVSLYPEGHPNDPELLKRIFDFNDHTRAIYHAARAASVYVSPVAKLMMELVTTARMTGPDTRTPYGDGLGLCVALASRSGGGKSVAMDQLEADARVFVRGVGFADNLAARDSRGGCILPGLASGQALVDALTEEEILPAPDDAPKGEKPRKRLKLRDPAVVTVAEDELDNLALKSSGASILTNAILSAWSERPIGDLSRAHGEKIVTRAMGHYMLILVGGIQPRRADPIVGREAAGSGLAQRIFFVGLEDPWFADTNTGELFPDAAGVTTSGLPKEGKQFRTAPIPEAAFMELPEAASRAMRIQNAHTAAGDQDAGETHLNRIRIRLACLMALTMGETIVSPEVWDWSEALMEHRRRALVFVEHGARTAAQDAADEMETIRARGRVVGAAAVTSDVENLAGELLTKIRGGITLMGDLKRSFGKKKRASFGPAIQALKEAGVITATTGARGSETYALVE